MQTVLSLYMEVVKRAWICIGLVAGCHGERSNEPLITKGAPTPASAATAPLRSPLADSFAVLPLSIVAAEPRPVAWLTEQMTDQVQPVFAAACWSTIASKVDGYYGIKLASEPDGVVFHPSAVHGRISLDELRRCRAPEEQRQESKSPKVLVARDSGFFPVVFADLGNGWTLMIDGELAAILAAAEAMVGELPTTEQNGLANAVGNTAEPGWRAVGLDVTSEVLGVASIGVRADFTPTPALEPLKEPVTLTVYFASANDAKRALTAMGTARDDLFGDTPKRILETARELGEVRVDGATVVYRGPITKELADWEQMFLGRSKPVLPR